MAMMRTALPVLALALLCVGFSRASDQLDTEDSARDEYFDQEEEEETDDVFPDKSYPENWNDSQPLNKVVAFDPTLALDAFDVVSKLATSIISNIFEGQAVAVLKEIRDLLKETNKRLEQLSDQVAGVLKAVIINHEVTRIISVYTKDILRIKSLASFLHDETNFNENNQIIVNVNSKRWAEAVLSHEDDGIAQILTNIDAMIKGGNFVARPAMTVLAESLSNRASSNLFQQVEVLRQSFVEHEAAGYSCWMVALDVEGRSSEKAKIKSLMEERVTAQDGPLKAYMPSVYWPGDHFGLSLPKTGCPFGTWHTGWRRHDGDGPRKGWWTSGYHGGNNWSGDIVKYLRGSFKNDHLSWDFCMNRDYTSREGVAWPRGRYCVFAGSSTCPAGLRRGSLYFDDDNSHNSNRQAGALPYGSYGTNTRYYFCCRTDGSVYTPMTLPTARPFFLFPLRNNGCQRVNGMKSSEFYIFFDTESGNSRQYPYPKETDQGGNMKIYMCYYRKI